MALSQAAVWKEYCGSVSVTILAIRSQNFGESYIKVTLSGSQLRIQTPMLSGLEVILEEVELLDPDHDSTENKLSNRLLVDGQFKHRPGCVHLQQDGHADGQAHCKCGSHTQR